MYITESEWDESLSSTSPCESGDNGFCGSTMANMIAANPVTRNWGTTIKVLWTPYWSFKKWKWWETSVILNKTHKDNPRFWAQCWWDGSITSAHTIYSAVRFLFVQDDFRVFVLNVNNLVSELELNATVTQLGKGSHITRQQTSKPASSSLFSSSESCSRKTSRSPCSWGHVRASARSISSLAVGSVRMASAS